MHLRNSQYAAIMRVYDMRQAHDRHVLEEHRREVARRLPEYQQEASKLNELCAAQARNAVLGGISRHEQEDFHRKARRIEMHLRDLLKDGGFPPDYLEMSYTCPDCRDTGFIGNEKCHCFNKAVVELLYDQSGLGEVLNRENFTTFREDYYSDAADPDLGISPRQNIRNILARAHQFTDNFDRAHENLLFYGNTGVGKTFLCNCIAKELLDTSHTVIYMTAIRLMDILSDSAFDRNDIENSDDMAGYILDCDLLIIDDLGSELSNAFVNSRLFDCINRRIEDSLSTIISTNLSLNQLQNIFSERIFSRLIGSYDMLPIIGDDIRVKKAIGRY